MPMRYADQDDVLAALKIKDADTAAIARVTKLENGLAATFDGMVGRRFGETPLPETRVVEGLGSDVLVLGAGVRSVIGVAIGGTWDGVAWTDETPLGPEQWAPCLVGRDGIAYGLRRLGAGLVLMGRSGLEWTGPVRVTALWADQDTTAVPADVREALTFLTVRQYRRLTTSPTEQVGPEGQMVPTPHAWDDPQVKATIARYRVAEVLV